MGGRLYSEEDPDRYTLNYERYEAFPAIKACFLAQSQSCPIDASILLFPSNVLDHVRRVHCHSRQDPEDGLVVAAEIADQGLLQTYGKLMAIDP